VEQSKISEFTHNKGKDMKEIVLASASPRRREILENIGLQFKVAICDADEDRVDKSIPVNLYVQELALLKAGEAAKLDLGDALIISADTVVYSGDEIMGKPKNSDDAKRMLAALSGKAHSVFTGICVTRKKDMFSVCASVETRVFFKDLSPEMIDAYVATGEPMDKAGAYGIQGKGCALVEKIDGDYYNVVGLPASKLCEILKKEFDFDVF